ncbi:MAG: N-acetylmuramoyl-L-alanine amidase [Chitinispirillaceae bacterium]|nr:N-acetylmuramoyl-L-alanine amidase [Chitinispirillaceae bacterium]
MKKRRFLTITGCLLDADNPLAAGGATIGALVASSGRRHLWERRSGAAVDVIVVHYTSAAVVAHGTPFEKWRVLKLFCDYGVSSHYLIGRRGGVIRLAPEEMKAWHAGGSIMPEPDNRRAVNDFSIGIELLATADSGFTAAQYRALMRLCADIERRNGRRFSYVGHDQVAGERAVALGLRSEPKIDPGPLFDWERFFAGLEKERGRAASFNGN